MQVLEFKSSKDFTVGAELELQLIDKESRDLSSSTSTILRGLKNYPYLKHELFESVIEINSNPCNTVKELAEDLKKHVNVLYNEASKIGVTITAAGTHPTANWSRQIISPVKRYQNIANKIQMPIRRMLTFGLHTHVGLRSGDEAVFVNNALMNYLPHLLAITVSSPFWVKRDSGMESYRVKILETLPTTGIPFKLKNWEDYCEMAYVLHIAGTIDSIRDIWWDVRPHPDFGTVEVRVCDAVPVFDDVVSVIALVQCLIAYLAKKYRAKKEIKLFPSFLIRENKWRAARFGLNAELITDYSGTTIPIKWEIEKLIDELMPVASELKANEELAKVTDIFKRGTSSKRQRNIFSESGGNWNTVIDSLINEFEKTWGLKHVGADPCVCP